MGRVIVDISMSLDGYITAAGQTPAEPLGSGGLRLHDWGFAGDERDRELARQQHARIGAYICGRRCYEHSLPWWHADGPTGADRTPVVIVTHTPPTPGEVSANSVYTFTGDMLSALDTARQLAGERAVRVMGGAAIIRQYLAAGLADELLLHVVPVLFGGGTPLFTTSERAALSSHIGLEQIAITPTTTAVHLHYRILGPLDTSTSADTHA